MRPSAKESPIFGPAPKSKIHFSRSDRSPQAGQTTSQFSQSLVSLTATSAGLTTTKPGQTANTRPVRPPPTWQPVELAENEQFDKPSMAKENRTHFSRSPTSKFQVIQYHWKFEVRRSADLYAWAIARVLHMHMNTNALSGIVNSGILNNYLMVILMLL